MFKITSKRRTQLVNGRVKRTGRVYFEVAYWTGTHWSYREFNTRKEANEFCESLATA